VSAGIALRLRIGGQRDRAPGLSDVDLLSAGLADPPDYRRTHGLPEPPSEIIESGELCRITEMKASLQSQSI
jgi:hypothetical protein